MILACGIFCPSGTPSSLWRAPGCLTAPCIHLSAIARPLFAVVIAALGHVLAVIWGGLGRHHAAGVLDGSRAGSITVRARAALNRLFGIVMRAVADRLGHGRNAEIAARHRVAASHGLTRLHSIRAIHFRVHGEAPEIKKRAERRLAGW